MSCLAQRLDPNPCLGCGVGYNAVDVLETTVNVGAETSAMGYGARLLRWMKDTTESLYVKRSSGCVLFEERIRSC